MRCFDWCGRFAESPPGSRDVCMALIKSIVDDDREVRFEVANVLVRFLSLLHG